VKPKLKPIPCRCSGYQFPHRLNGGRCAEVQQAMDERRQVDALRNMTPGEQRGAIRACRADVD
jgi:hypothetical protein